MSKSLSTSSYDWDLERNLSTISPILLWELAWANNDNWSAGKSPKSKKAHKIWCFGFGIVVVGQ